MVEVRANDKIHNAAFASAESAFADDDSDPDATIGPLEAACLVYYEERRKLETEPKSVEEIKEICKAIWDE